MNTSFTALDTACLISDCGHPQGPGWQWIVAALILAQLAIWFSSNADGQLMPRRANSRTQYRTFSRARPNRRLKFNFGADA